MRITCIIGPYLPVPPLLGGAVERIFLTLCQEFARRGHEVTMISRRFGDLPNAEIVENVRHIRIPSTNAPANKVLYRLLDVVYGLRASRALPPSDVTITHSVSLPCFIPRKRAGKIYVSVARFPKNQMGMYRRADRLQAVSTHVGDAIREQSPSVAHLVKTVPNAIGERFAAAIQNERGVRRKEIVFVGRIAREKGIDLLIKAFNQLAPRYPEWRLVIVGPHAASQGGDGDAFLDELKKLGGAAMDRITFTGPIFDEAKLIERYKASDIFVYPSVAAQGEAAGLAPLEAMACGCAVVLSGLECFLDYFRDGENGRVFDHEDATGSDLARVLAELMTDAAARDALAREGIATARNFTAESVAGLFLDDFRALTTGAPA